MPTNNSSLDDLEAEGLRKKEKYKTYETKRELKKNDPKLKLIRSAFSTSLFLSLLRPGYLLKYFYWIIWGTSTFFAIPYFRYFIKGAPVKVGGGKYGGVYILDPPNDGYGLFYPFIVSTTLVMVYYIIGWIAKKRVPAINKREEDWAISQPFPIDNWPNVLGANDDERVYIKVYYKSNTPNESKMENIARSFNEYDGYYRNERELKDEFKIKFNDSGKRSGYRLYKRFHNLMENVFLPIHQDFPLKK